MRPGSPDHHTRPASRDHARGRAVPRPGLPVHPRRAFSLVELVVVTVIVGVLAAIAAPRFAGASDRYRSDAAARRIVADLSAVQERAMAASAPRGVTFTLNSAQYLVDSGPASRASDSTVDLSREPYRAVVRAVTFAGGRVVFDGFGVPAASGSVTVACGLWSATVTVDGASSPASTGAVLAGVP